MPSRIFVMTFAGKKVASAVFRSNAINSRGGEYAQLAKLGHAVAIRKVGRDKKAAPGNAQAPPADLAGSRRKSVGSAVLEFSDKQRAHNLSPDEAQKKVVPAVVYFA